MTEKKQSNEQRLNEPESDRVDVSRMHLGLSREHDEPEEGSEPMPWWLPTLIVGLLVWAGYYVGRYGGTFDASTYDPVGFGQVAMEKAPESAIERGQLVYRTACVACHQTDGRGVPGQFPPLAGSEVVLEKEEAVIRIVLHGLTGPLVVGGERYDGTMPAWGGTLNDAQIADVVTYVRGSWGNQAAAVGADRVTELREKDAKRDSPWTARELGLPQ